MPGLMGAPCAFQFILTPGEIIILPENNSVHRIFTDGRKYPEDGEATFNGHSIGYWENNVLVVETVNMNNKAEYFMGLKTSGRLVLICNHHSRRFISHQQTRVYFRRSQFVSALIHERRQHLRHFYFI